MKYEYPAVINYNFNDKVYYVNFPDLHNCFTDGETLREAIDNAEDVLNLMLVNVEDNGLEIPDASKMEDVHLEAGEIIIAVKADTDLYSKIAI